MKRTITISPTYQSCPGGGWNINIGDIKINVCYTYYHSESENSASSPTRKEWQHYYSRFFPFSSINGSYIYTWIKSPLATAPQDLKYNKDAKENKENKDNKNDKENKENKDSKENKNDKENKDDKENKNNKEENKAKSDIFIYKCPPTTEIKINSVEFKNNVMTITGTGFIDQINKPEATSIVTYIKHPVAEEQIPSVGSSDSDRKHYIGEPKAGIDLLPIFPTSWTPGKNEDTSYIKRLENGMDQIIYACNRDPELCKNLFANIQSVQLQLTLYSNGEYYVCASNLFKIAK